MTGEHLQPEDLDATLSEALTGALVDLFGLPPEELSPGAELEGDLALDSLAIVELETALEDALGVRLRVDGPVAVCTLGDLQRVIDMALLRGEPVLDLTQS